MVQSAPDLFAGGLIVGGEESSHALFAAGGAGDDEVFDSQHGAGGVVVLAVVGHLGVPENRAGEAVEGDQVGVVCLHEDAVAGHRDAAVIAGGAGVADEALRGGARELPELGSRTGVERDDGVGVGDVHDTVMHLGRALQSRGVRDRENPLEGELRQRWPY